MSFARCVLSLVIVLAAAVSPVSAQDAGQFGLVAAFPGSVGMHWQVADRWAVRVDGSYSFSKNVTESGDGLNFSSTVPTGLSQPTFVISTRNEASTHTSTIGVSALITVHQRDSLRLYVAPRVAWALASLKSVTTTELSLPPGFPVPGLDELLRPRTIEDSTRTPSFGAVFGASTKIGDRFGVFGEVGFNYSHSDSPVLSSIQIDSERTSIGTRAGVGVMLIF
jgi:hypothetical protein